MYHEPFEAARETVGRYTVRVVADDHTRDWDDVLCDQPVAVVAPTYRHGWSMAVQHDNSTRLTETAMHAAWILDRNGMADMLDLLSVRYEESTTPTGRLHIKADIWDWKGRTFRDEASAAACIFAHETGQELAAVRWFECDTRSDTFAVFWHADEYAEYAGTVDAKPHKGEIQDFIDGNVWGFIVGDDEDDHLESCWGFIGGSTYAMEEGRDVAEHLEAEARNADAEAYAEAMLIERPDLAPCYL